MPRCPGQVARASRPHRHLEPVDDTAPAGPLVEASPVLAGLVGLPPSSVVSLGSPRRTEAARPISELIAEIRAHVNRRIPRWEGGRPPRASSRRSKRPGRSHSAARSSPRPPVDAEVGFLALRTGKAARRSSAHRRRVTLAKLGSSGQPPPMSTREPTQSGPGISGRFARLLRPSRRSSGGFGPPCGWR